MLLTYSECVVEPMHWLGPDEGALAGAAPGYSVVAFGLYITMYCGVIRTLQGVDSHTYGTLVCVVVLHAESMVVTAATVSYGRVGAAPVGAGSCSGSNGENSDQGGRLSRSD